MEGKEGRKEGNASRWGWIGEGREKKEVNRTKAKARVERRGGRRKEGKK